MHLHRSIAQNGCTSNDVFHRRCGLSAICFTKEVDLQRSVSAKWWTFNDPFHGSGGPSTICFTEEVDLQRSVSPKWWTCNDLFHRSGGLSTTHFTEAVDLQRSVSPKRWTFSDLFHRGGGPSTVCFTEKVDLQRFHRMKGHWTIHSTEECIYASIDTTLSHSFNNCIVLLGFLPWDIGLLSPGKARVALPNLWCMLGALVFP